MTYEQFKNYYIDNGRCINDIGERKNTINEKQLNSKYEKYVKQEKKKQEKKEQNILKKIEKDQERLKEVIENNFEDDSKWQETRLYIMRRDSYKCRLEAIMSFSEIREWKNNAPVHMREILDCAHIIRRSNAPHLIYEYDNIVLLNRYSHSMLDQYKSPINGKNITKKEVENWWKRIVGNELYEKLIKM